MSWLGNWMAADEADRAEDGTISKSQTLAVHRLYSLFTASIKSLGWTRTDPGCTCSRSVVL